MSLKSYMNPQHDFIEEPVSSVMKRVSAIRCTEFHTSKSIQLSECREDSFSPRNGVSNYLSKIKADKKINNTKEFHSSINFRSPQTISLLERISHKSRKRSEPRQPDFLKFCNTAFACPKVVKAIPTVMLDKNMDFNPAQSFKINEKQPSPKRKVSLTPFMDKFVNVSETQNITNKKYALVSFTPIKPRAATINKTSSSIKIIVESKGKFQTVSGKELMKEYELLRNVKK